MEILVGPCGLVRVFSQNELPCQVLALASEDMVVLVRLSFPASLSITLGVLFPPVGPKRATWDNVTLVSPPESAGSVGNLGLPELAPLGLGARFRVHRRVGRGWFGFGSREEVLSDLCDGGSP